MNIFITIVVFILILGILVLVHEWGHFVVARLRGIKVYEFGIGFPPRACSWYRDPKSKKWVFVSGKGKSKLSDTVGGEERMEEYPSTLYSLNWLPLGGFVKIKGENGEDRSDPDSFVSHKTWEKSAVLVAGVLMNFLLAAILLGIGFIVGLPTDFSGGIDPQAIVMQAGAPTVQQVDKNSPAEHAGLELGDRILDIDGKAVTSTDGMIAFIHAHQTQTLTLTVQQNKQIDQVSLTPEVLSGETAPRIGVSLVDAGMIRFPWYLAIYKGFVAATIGVITIMIGFYVLISQLVLGHGLAFAVEGPVGIANVVGQSIHMGWNYVINIAAMISLSLAVINILPIPALDGGRLFFVLLEKVTHRAVPQKYEQLAHTIGFIALMILVVVVTWHDVVNLL